MPTITTDAPGVAVPKDIAVVLTTANTDLVEAPNFNVPNPDPEGETDRVVVPGQIQFRTPVIVYNVSNQNVTVDMVFITESNTEIYVAKQYIIPANDALILPVQGQSLLRSASSTIGGRLRARAQANNALHVKCMAVEFQADQHAPNTEI